MTAVVSTPSNGVWEVILAQGGFKVHIPCKDYLTARAMCDALVENGKDIQHY